ncbi:unnamed protein product, partial [Mesorhabditis belari]|uniref:Uncharacterized protein n=1 Tax=Mesorhabditis belari TaxID=2138241 RepID=A0AAF3F1D5_9BILA
MRLGAWWLLCLIGAVAVLLPGIYSTKWMMNKRLIPKWWPQMTSTKQKTRKSNRSLFIGPYRLNAKILRQLNGAQQIRYR